YGAGGAHGQPELSAHDLLRPGWLLGRRARGSGRDGRLDARVWRGAHGGPARRDAAPGSALRVLLGAQGLRARYDGRCAMNPPVETGQHRIDQDDLDDPDYGERRYVVGERHAPNRSW